MEGKQHDNGLMEDGGVFTHEITSVENGDCSSSLNGKVVNIARTLHGSFLSPSYLNTPGPAATVHLSLPVSVLKSLIVATTSSTIHIDHSQSYNYTFFFMDSYSLLFFF